MQALIVYYDIFRHKLKRSTVNSPRPERVYLPFSLVTMITSIELLVATG